MTAAIVSNHSSSSARVKKFRENMVKHGFKRVQKWVFDLESIIFQEQMKHDLANYKKTTGAEEWDDFAGDQLYKIEGWK